SFRASSIARALALVIVSLRIRSLRSRKTRWPKVSRVVPSRAEKTRAARTRLRAVCGRERSMGLKSGFPAIVRGQKYGTRGQGCQNCVPPESEPAAKAWPSFRFHERADHGSAFSSVRAENPWAWHRNRCYILVAASLQQMQQTAPRWT